MFLSLQFKPLKHSLSCTLMNIKINWIFTMFMQKTTVRSRQYPACICLFKVNNGTLEQFVEVYFLPFQYHSPVESEQKWHKLKVWNTSKSKIMTPEQRQCARYGVFVVDLSKYRLSENPIDVVLVLFLLILSKYLPNQHHPSNHPIIPAKTNTIRYI